MTKEERVAVMLMDRKAIQAEIDAKKALLGQMVGWLYRSVLADEIAEWQAILDRKADCRLSAVGAR